MEQVDNKTSKSKKSNGDSSLTVGLSIIMALFLIGLIGWGIWAAGHYLVVKSIADSNFRDGIIAFVIVIIAAVVGYSFYRYLRKGISTEKKNLDILMKEFSDFLEKQKNETSQISANVEMELNKALDKIATNFKKSITVDFSVEQRSEIFQRLNEAIATNINNDFIEKVHNSIRNELKTSIQIRAEEITSDFDRISKRLLNEIKDLRLTSFRNLGIGSFVTVIALTSLIYFVLNEKFNIDDKMSIVIHFLPRLSLAIFIELFAFFFLKLYRTNLNEIKYYHNELTNAELKYTSLHTATVYGGKDDITSIVKTLADTERNFILKKGESTVDIEKSKLEKDSLKEVLATISKSLTRK